MLGNFNEKKKRLRKDKFYIVFLQHVKCTVSVENHNHLIRHVERTPSTPEEAISCSTAGHPKFILFARNAETEGMANQ